VSNKEQYIGICEKNELPLQMQPWWLDIVCGIDNWNVCLSVDKENQVVGVLPYYSKPQFGLKRITMPPFTDYIGPWVKTPDEPNLKRVSHYNISTAILSDLVRQLPRVSLFYQTYFHAMDNSLPFQWLGYTITPYYTYILESDIIPDQVFDAFKYTVRTEIRKAEKSVRIIKEGSIEDFYSVNSSSFKRKKMDNPYDFELLKKLDDRLGSKAKRQVYLARDIETEEIHAGLYLVWDAETAYVLLTGVDPVLRKSGALYLLYWEAIKDAAKMGLSLDFCGSILPEIESSLRSFGGKRCVYYCASKTSNKLLAVLSLIFNKAYH
jgi:hypothetical protein